MGVPTFGGDRCCEGLTEASGKCSTGRDGKMLEEDAAFVVTVNGRQSSEVQFILGCGCQGLSKVGVADGVFTCVNGVVPEPLIKVFGLVSGVGGTKFRTSGCWEFASPEALIRTLSVVGVGVDVGVGVGVVVVVVLSPGISCLLCILFMDVDRHLLSDI